MFFPVVATQWGSTALHLSCRRRHISIAIVLLQAGCQFDIVDQNGETALHPACREGLLPVVQTMCAYGCKVDIVSKVHHLYYRNVMFTYLLTYVAFEFMVITLLHLLEISFY